MKEEPMSRPLRQIDSLTATVDQLSAELQALSTQVVILLGAMAAMTLLVGIVLWAR